MSYSGWAFGIAATRIRQQRCRVHPKGKVIEVDPNWWKPMSDKEVEDFLEKRC